MKTKKILSPLVVSTLTLTSLMSSNSFGQFNKYKSKTKFQSNKAKSSKTEDKGDLVIPDSGKSVKSAKDLLNKPANDTTNFIDEEESLSSNNEGDAGEDTETDTFGRKSKSNTNPSKIDKKYVNLNPETAFGPEIVTSFDFKDVSILDLTKHMQKLTGLNLILDKDVKGKISISSPTAITMGDAWKAYLQALSINGYSLVKTGAYYTIVNNRDIRYSPTTMYTGTYTPNTENYVMQIIPLKYVNSREVANSFRPFMSRYGRIIEIKQTNTVIVQETGTHITRLLKLIKFIDIPGHEESLQIIKVKNSSAQEIAGLLDKILKSSQNDAKFKTSTTGQTSQVNISKIIAEPRTNSIIAMANSDGARELKALIEKLDVKVVASGAGQVHVYYLNYGDAENLAKTLTSLSSGSSKSNSGLSRFTSGAGGAATTGTLFNADVKITADKENNAIVVNASPTDYETVRAVISKLDIPRDQVYVEGLMMETQVNKGQGFGVSIVGAYGSGGTQKSGYGKTNDLLSLMTNNITNLSGLFVGMGAGRKVDLSTPDGKTIKVNSVNGLISAIATNNNTNVLATPQILTLDNVEGVFENGEQVPYVDSTVANGQTQNSIKQQKVALTLKITPQINKATRFIKLKIDQKIEDFSNRELPAGVAQNGVGTVVRSLNTTVVCRDKDTIAMGGLMRDKEINTVNKVPLLGDIPVLGWLFKNTKKEVEKVNLLFFMTPKILSSYEKENSENVKDLLNRRQAHLKNAGEDTEAFASTVKGIYEKAKKQGAGPLYDSKDAQPYSNQLPVGNSVSIPGRADTVEEPELPNASTQLSPPVANPIDGVDIMEQADTPDYQQIMNEASSGSESSIE